MSADLPGIKGPPVPVPIAEFSWTGPYAGGQIGYAAGHDVTKEYFTAGRIFIGLQNYFTPKGFLAGLHAGYNYQYGALVVGLEADAEVTDVRGGFVDPPAAPFNPGGYGNTRVNYQASLRARLGLALGRTMIYTTGGPSVAQIETTYKNWGLVSETFKKTVAGLTAGGGVEHAVTDYLTLRAEYRFTAYPKFWNDSLVAFPGFSGSQHPRNHALRIGASYRF